MNTITLINRYFVENRDVMDIQLEKAAIIDRLKKVEDESLIKAFKNLLDYALRREETDELLESSINRGLAQSENDEVTSHQTVMSELRSRYKA